MDTQTLLAWLEWLCSFGGPWAVYVGIFGILLASGFGLPLPEDIPLLVGGLLCHLGHASLWVMIPGCTAAIILADLMVYLLGRKYGHHVHRLPLLRVYLSEKRLAAAEIAFHKHGGKTLFVGRFLPGIRTAIFFTAGIFRIPMWKMIAFDGSAALLSVPTLIFAGYFGAQQFQRVTEWTGIAQLVMGAVLATAIVGFIVWHKLRRKQKQDEVAPTEPLQATPPASATTVASLPVERNVNAASTVAAKLSKGAGPLPS